MNWQAAWLSISAALVAGVVFASLVGAVALARAGRWRRGLLLGGAAVGYLFGLVAAVGGAWWGVWLAWACGITIGAIAALYWRERRRRTITTTTTERHPDEP